MHEIPNFSFLHPRIHNYIYMTPSSMFSPQPTMMTSNDLSLTTVTQKHTGSGFDWNLT